MTKKKYVVTYQIKRVIMGRTYTLPGDPVTIQATSFKEARMIFKENFKATAKNKAVNIKVFEKDRMIGRTEVKTDEEV